MKNLEFTVDIQAPAGKVWRTLWEDATYRQWTSIFDEGSYVKGDFTEGSRVQFLGSGGGGMYSTVVRNVPGKYMSFRHEGEIKNGEEQPVEDAKEWSGATENYALTEHDGITTLKVSMDITENHADSFNKMFPQALEKVKQLAGKQGTV